MIWFDSITHFIVLNEIISKKYEEDKVMLHYSQNGVQRSPNYKQDLLRANPLLQEKYDFITLDQPGVPSQDGHINAINGLYKQIK